MLLVRKDRVTLVPAISLAMTSVLTAILVQRVWMADQPIAPLLPGFALPAVGFLIFAVVSVCRLERRGARIHWGRLRLHGSEDAALCAMCADAYANRNGGFLAIDLLVRGEPALQVIVLRDGDKAQAKAQRIAEALGLPLERASDASPPAKAGSTKRGRDRRKR